MLSLLTLGVVAVGSMTVFAQRMSSCCSQIACLWMNVKYSTCSLAIAILHTKHLVIYIFPTGLQFLCIKWLFRTHLTLVVVFCLLLFSQCFECWSCVSPTFLFVVTSPSGEPTWISELWAESLWGEEMWKLHLCKWERCVSCIAWDAFGWVQSWQGCWPQQ